MIRIPIKLFQKIEPKKPYMWGFFGPVFVEFELGIRMRQFDRVMERITDSLLQGI